MSAVGYASLCSPALLVYQQLHGGIQLSEQHEQPYVYYQQLVTCIALFSSVPSGRLHCGTHVHCCLSAVPAALQPLSVGQLLLNTHMSHNFPCHNSLHWLICAFALNHCAGAGLGMFTTEPVSVGQLLLISQPLATTALLPDTVAAGEPNMLALLAVPCNMAQQVNPGQERQGPSLTLFNLSHKPRLILQ